jgi:hypothetical protein
MFVYKSLKMAALLLHCEVVKQRTVTRVLWSEGIKTFEMSDSIPIEIR